ncbi:MAG: flagellar motor switch protein FliG [Defluviimonas sp.]|uniref:flagellar motor switch protein FliG n=1 Tax=Albidovulum sp. TaxID=1872424 RepID=UPI001D2CA546|nr:flagellar motor switch protein FliG [Paracoccaceae bacterium]MCC0064108.1 flagellar motor switch protein FliG [Defluviimonas sp.]
MNAVTSLPSRPGAAPLAGPRALSGREKAAVIVRLLLSEGGELPIRGLPEGMQAALTEQIGTMRSIDRATLRSVVEEFLQRLESVGLSFPGGIEGALALLDGHLSPPAAERLRERSHGDRPPDPWERIAALSDDRLIAVLGAESTEVAAVVMSKLAVPRAAELLGKLPGDRARRVLHGVSLIAGIAPEVVADIGAALAAALGEEAPKAFAAAPHERVGAILNAATASMRDDVLAGLDSDDADFALRVRKAIFTFADIPARVAVRDVPKVLRGIDQSVLVTAFAGAASEADGQTVEFLLAGMSQRLAASLREEMAERGAVKLKDAEMAMAALVGNIREIEAAGEITLIVEEEDEA